MFFFANGNYVQVLEAVITNEMLQRDSYRIVPVKQIINYASPGLLLFE
jgi:hypothetical protein